MNDAPNETAAGARVIVHHEGGGNPADAAPKSARTESVAELRMPSRELSTPRTCPIVDASGRRLIVQKLSAMDRLNMYEAAGPAMSSNEGWMGMVALACSCVEIDGTRLDKPLSALEMKALVARLEADGLDAVEHVYLKVFGVKNPDDAPKIKN